MSKKKRNRKYNYRLYKWEVTEISPSEWLSLNIHRLKNQPFRSSFFNWLRGREKNETFPPTPTKCRINRAPPCFPLKVTLEGWYERKPVVPAPFLCCRLTLWRASILVSRAGRGDLLLSLKVILTWPVDVAAAACQSRIRRQSCRNGKPLAFIIGSIEVTEVWQLYAVCRFTFSFFFFAGGRVDGNVVVGTHPKLLLFKLLVQQLALVQTALSSGL